MSTMRCKQNELTSFPIMSNESFTFDYNDKRGVELEFKHRRNGNGNWDGLRGYLLIIFEAKANNILFVFVLL